MKRFPDPLDLSKLRVFPLATRRSLNPIERLLAQFPIQTDKISAGNLALVKQCVGDIRSARERDATVLLIYGAHLVKNGLLPIVNQMIAGGWITHLATNGAGTIHDWELAFLGRTEESVRENVATGSFGTWDETGRGTSWRGLWTKSRKIYRRRRDDFAVTV
jgi:hypothetical protein